LLNRNVPDLKQTSLAQALEDIGRCAVAFSGGTDSSFLLHAAVEALGNSNVLAVTCLSPVTSQYESEFADRMANMLEVSHLKVDSDEFSLDEFTRNDAQRCYVCKKLRYSRLIEEAHKLGYPVVLDGENSDDADDYRPGSRAARELGVRSPLSEVGLTKDEIRTLSRELGIPSWNRPSSACLASRIPYGSPLTIEKLGQVEKAEDFLRRAFGEGQFRVRHHGEIARIETDQDLLPRLIRRESRIRVVEHFRSLGFVYVGLDLACYAKGSLNHCVNQKP
jgi:pyridinium-3,5-biscarboxylic acid mononucleotide sulfurtransferase